VYSKQSISELAYQLWSARGRPHGSEEEDWLEAERQLAVAADINADGGRRDRAIDMSLKESFPASDPAASHIPDLPPSNAAEKWSAAGKEPRSESRPRLKSASASHLGDKAIGSAEDSNAPVDESDDGPPTAARDIGEG
jgi:hypothetical protein